MNPNEWQVGGTHYKSEFQHWDFVTECLDGLYLEGCITKYVSRWRKKSGRQDLEKARHYIFKLMELAKSGETGPTAGILERVQEFCNANELNDAETKIVTGIASWSTLTDLEAVEEELCKLIDETAEIATGPFG